MRRPRSSLTRRPEFQSTHPRGVRRGRTCVLARLTEFQSTHPRGVRPPLPPSDDPQQQISIHAPARGATVPPLVDDGVGKISIHAPARGATISETVRTHETAAISIHAPARGATRRFSSENPFLTYFNPRTREGCDSNAVCAADEHKYFNPRTREGCDMRGKMSYQDLAIFQSTHPRGVRRTRYPTNNLQHRISIHAPARGATACKRAYYFRYVISIHAPARGATVRFRKRF